jgi:hypothetical protein
LSSHAVYCTRSNQGKNLGALLRRMSQKILAFDELALRASPITLDGVTCLKDSQTSKGYVVGLSTSFGPNASGNLSFRTQWGNAAIIIIDVSGDHRRLGCADTLLNLKHRGKWFAPMRQFVDRRGRDWSCEVASEVRCKRRECGHARNLLWMIGSKQVPCD